MGNLVLQAELWRDEGYTPGYVFGWAQSGLQKLQKGENVKIDFLIINQ